MPKIDSITGCPVMTTGEFWASEAKKEGKEVAEIMSDFYDDLAKEEESSRQTILSDLSGALDKLKEYYHPEYDDSGLIPVEVLEISDADCCFNFKKSTSRFTAKVRFSDKIRIVSYSEANYSGSFYEPPDFEANCEIVNEF